MRRSAVVLALACLTAAAGSSASSAQPSEKERDEVEAEVDALGDDLGAAVDRYTQLQSELAGIRERSTILELEVRTIAKRMFALEEEAVNIARQLYMSGNGPMESLLTAKDLTEVGRRLDYLESTSEAQSEVLVGLKRDRVVLEDRLDALDAQRSATEAAVAEMADLRASIGAALAEQEAELDSIDAALAAAAEQVVSSAPPTASAPVPGPPYNADWDAIAMCESGGNWHLDSTYDGGLQFHPSTWLGYGGGRYARYAWQASREEQIAIAEKVLAGQGPGAWPNCFKEL